MPKHKAGSNSNTVAKDRTADIEANVPYLEVPRDEEDWRFAHSFAPVGEEEEARRFFDQYGFVVFRGVLLAAVATALLPPDCLLPAIAGLPAASFLRQASFPMTKPRLDFRL